MTSAVHPSAADKPTVLLVAPMPSGPIVGGIANGVKLMLRSRIVDATSLDLFNTYRREDTTRSLRERLTYQIASALRFGWTVLRTRPAIVHVKAASYVNYYQAAVYAVLARILGRAVVLQLHAGDFPQFYDSRSNLQRALIRWSLRVPHRLMALSDGWARYFRDLSGGASVTVVPNALVTSEYADAVGDRAGFGIPTDRVALLFVGTCNRDADAAKGLAELVEAVARARKSAPELLLVAAGVASEDNVLSPALGRSGDGWMSVGVVPSERKPALYRSVDVFTLPSRFENMPNTLIEAMAAGLPSVSTDVGAIPEMISDGDDGFLVRVAEVDALAARLTQLTTDPALRRRLGARAALVAAERFDLRLLEDRMLAEYRRLLGGSDDAPAPTGATRASAAPR